MVPLRHQKYCLRLLTLGILSVAALVLTSDAAPQISETSDDSEIANTSKARSSGIDEATAAETLDFEPVLSRSLQQRLFDPPPPPKKKEVKPAPPPLSIKLLGTVIDSSNSQAIIEDQRGSVNFRSLGQPVSTDHPDSVIEEILPAAIQVRREGQVDTVSVE